MDSKLGEIYVLLAMVPQDSWWGVWSLNQLTCRLRVRGKASHGQGTRCTSTTLAHSLTGKPMIPPVPKTCSPFPGLNLTLLETGASSFHSTLARVRWFHKIIPLKSSKHFTLAPGLTPYTNRACRQSRGFPASSNSFFLPSDSRKCYVRDGLTSVQILNWLLYSSSGDQGLGHWSVNDESWGGRYSFH